MNFESIKNTLTELQNVILQLKPSDFCQPIPALSEATIGEHTRHILELFQCLTTAYTTGVLNYDNRDRNRLIQTDKNFAVQIIDQLKNEINKPNKTLILEHQITEEAVCFETNYFREILYNFEHCIHHQALIKVGLMEFEYIKIEENFGVAPSTIAYRKQCVQ